MTFSTNTNGGLGLTSPPVLGFTDGLMLWLQSPTDAIISIPTVLIGGTDATGAYTLGLLMPIGILALMLFGGSNNYRRYR
jgi:hypothetical protein